jgi:hypothetical protein
MTDYAAVIRRVIEEHRILRQGEAGVNQSINDIGAFFSLQRAYAGWSQSSIDQLAGQQKKLTDTVKNLDQGLRRHFAYEEEALPPIFGQYLMQGLLMEHQDIGARLDKLVSTVAGMHLEGLGQEQSLRERAALQALINEVHGVVEAHAEREEVILKMLDRVFPQK